MRGVKVDSSTLGVDRPVPRGKWGGVTGGLNVRMDWSRILPRDDSTKGYIFIEGRGEIPGVK